VIVTKHMYMMYMMLHAILPGCLDYVELTQGK